MKKNSMGWGTNKQTYLCRWYLCGQATTCASEVGRYFSTQGPPVRCCWENTHLPFPLHCCLSACAGCCGSATSIATTPASSAIILPKQIHPPTHPETLKPTLLKPLNPLARSKPTSFNDTNDRQSHHLLLLLFLLLQASWYLVKRKEKNIPHSHVLKEGSQS